MSCSKEASIHCTKTMGRLKRKQICEDTEEEENCNMHSQEIELISSVNTECGETSDWDEYDSEFINDGPLDYESDTSMAKEEERQMTMAMKPCTKDGSGTDSQNDDIGSDAKPRKKRRIIDDTSSDDEQELEMSIGSDATKPVH